MINVLLWILYIILGIIALVIILGIILVLIKYRIVFFRDSDSYIVKFKVGFIKVYTIKSSDEKKAVIKHEKDDIIIEKDHKKISLNEIIQNFSLISQSIKEIACIAIESIKIFGKSLVVTNISIKITVSNEDPAETGRNYGILCSAFYPFMDFIDDKIKIKKRFYDLGYNFNEVSPYYKIEGKAYIRGFNLLRIALKMYGLLPVLDKIKKIIKGGVKNERTSD